MLKFSQFTTLPCICLYSQRINFPGQLVSLFLFPNGITFVFWSAQRDIPIAPLALNNGNMPHPTQAQVFLEKHLQDSA